MQLIVIHAKRVTVMMKNAKFVQIFFDSEKFISAFKFASKN